MGFVGFVMSDMQLYNSSSSLEVTFNWLLPRNVLWRVKCIVFFSSIDCAGILKLRNSDIELRKGETDIGRKNTRVRLVFRVHIPQPSGKVLSAPSLLERHWPRHLDTQLLQRWLGLRPPGRMWGQFECFCTGVPAHFVVTCIVFSG